MTSINKSLLSLVNEAEALGLNDKDAEIAKDFLEYNELSLCFETIVDQLGEYHVSITNEFYDKIEQAGIKLKLPKSTYSFLKELIK